MKIITKKNLLRLAILGFFLWLLGSYAGSIIATYPRQVDIPEATTFFTQIVENQRITTVDGVEIATWFLPSESKKGVVILNGIGANRVGLVTRAKFYQQNNYNVLIPDLRATGESGGDAITFGWQERLDLQACVDFLKSQSMESVAVHGLSLGAATITYSFQENPNYEFVVLESCYDNIDNALKNRVDRFPLPNFFFYALEKFTEWRIGVASEQLRPEDFIKKCQSPTFIMAGDSERKVKQEETEKIFRNCAAKTKQLHFFKGGYHENFLNRFEEEWKEEMVKWMEGVENEK